MAPPQDTWPVSGLGEVWEGSRRGCYADRQGHAPHALDGSEMTLGGTGEGPGGPDRPS
jgi:hypothetical protein